MRKIMLASFALVFCLSSCAFFGIGADATVTVTNHYWHAAAGQEVVDYTVKNTGTLPLVMVKVRFKAICEDGTSYQETWASFDLDLKQSVDETVMITTNASPVVEIKVMEIQKSTY
jgi:hypothetical protein